MPPEKEKTEEQPAEETRKPIKSLRTYQGDVEEAISKNNFSASSILIAEQKRKIEKKIEPEGEKTSIIRNGYFLIAGSIMLFLGILTVVTILYVRSRQAVVVEQSTKTLITFTEEKQIKVASSTRESLLADIVVEKNSFKLPANSVLYLNTVNSSLSTEKSDKILSLIAPQMPSALVRSLDGEYMLGVYSFGANEIFIILKSNDFSNSYSGMLKWEKDAVEDIGKLFSISTEAKYARDEFKDEALRNKDLRILQDENKRTVLLYSFIDKNTILITSNEDVFLSIMAKYNVSKQIR